MRNDYKIPDGDTKAAVDFLEKMFPEQPRHLVSISQKGYLEACTFSVNDEEEMYAWIDERQGEDNLYFHVNTLRPNIYNKKASKDDIVSAQFIHVDIDDPDAEERITNFNPKPTAIVHSGGGFHLYWSLAEPTDDLVRIEKINQAVAELLGGDNCHNIDRIMRLPGTVNVPNAKKQANGRIPALAELVNVDWSLRYTLNDFPQGEGPESAGPKGVVAQQPPVLSINLDALPPSLPTFTRTLIERGDNPERPRDGRVPHFPSRSEAVFRVACDLARLRCSAETIAGVLINPKFRISASVLEKKKPDQYALRQANAALAAVFDGWPDPDKYGNPRATMRNARVALQRLDLSFSYDQFQHRKIINGALLDEHQGEISDDACTFLRALIIDRFNFDPRAENVRDAANQLCLEHTFHPIRQMIDSLEWDGVSRVNKWLTTYLDAKDTALNQAIGRIMLIAAVRRIRAPGVKFDTIPVFEGKQGTGKSTALSILAGPGNHSDNEILTNDTKAHMEAMEGVWIYELSELSGLNKNEVERMKAFASRSEDRARMAYARHSVARPRQTIFVGTTNEHQYLKDRTGNRRFLPVKTGVIDLVGLRADRDQLWAEASLLEQQGESLVLPQDLWDFAAVEQQERVEDDPWLEKLAKIEDKVFEDEVRVLTADILGFTLEIPTDRQNPGHAKRLTALMRQLGWEAGKFKIAGKTARGFRRPKPDDHADDGAIPGSKNPPI